MISDEVRFISLTEGKLSDTIDFGRLPVRYEKNEKKNRNLPDIEG